MKVTAQAAEHAGLSIFDTTLHIPAEQRPFLPPRALTRVTLPLSAGPGPRFAVAVACAIVMAVVCLVLAVMLAASDGDMPSRFGFAATFAIASLVPAAVAFTAVRDALSGKPVLVVDIEGIRDARLGAPIPWDAIRAVTIVGGPGGIAAVRLTLAGEGTPSYNPFRIGGWSVDWSRRRIDRVVALTLLDRRPHDVAHTIVMLAARRGAVVDEAPTAPWP